MSPLLNSKKKDQAPSSAAKAKKPSKLFSGNKTWFVFAIISAVAAAAIIFGVLSQVVATTTYYVLGQNVAAKDRITPDMLKPVTTSQGGQPGNALDIGEVSAKATYAKYALKAGDIVTQSNTGTFQSLSQGIPQDFVVASFSADAKNAVAGKLETGNYIDLIAVNGSNSQPVAKYILRHVLLMDVSSDPSTIGSSSTTSSSTSTTANGANSATPAQPKSAQDQLRTGIPSLYTVALPPADAAKLALIKDTPIMVVLSPAASDKSFSDQNIQTTQGDLFSDSAVGNSGKGTDPTFGQNGTSAAPAAATPSSAPSVSPSTAPKPSATDSATPTASSGQ
jgi:hypothetical protein